MGWFKRIGQKIVNGARRIGAKIDSVVSPVLRAGHKIASAVGDTASKIKDFVAPALKMAGLGKYADKASAIVDKVERGSGSLKSGIEKGQSAVRESRVILQDPSTTMSNVRRIKADLGGMKKSLATAYMEAKDIGRTVR